MVVHAPLPGGEGGRHDDAEADVVAVHVADGGVGGAVVVVPAPRVAEEMRVSVDEGDAFATTLAITLSVPLSPAAPFSLAAASLDED